MDQQLELPGGLRLMETQVAGHTFQTDTQSLGMLQDIETSCVYKPLGKPECGQREMQFYESLLNSEHDSVLTQVKPLVPRFYYKLKLVVNNRDHTFLKLEDLTRDLVKPCIMDIKVGKRTWDPLATAQKRLAEEQKYTRCKQTLGLCLPGFQMYSLADGGETVLRHSKEYGKQLDVDGFCATMALFLNAQSSVCKPLVREILKQLYAIRSWFNVQTLYHFYASSVLIAYDFDALQAQLAKSAQNGQIVLTTTNGNVQNEESGLCICETGLNTDACSDPRHWVKVKMIDFAHVFPADSGSLDTNYLFGLQKLITIVERLLDR